MLNLGKPGYVLYMEDENPRLADRFADTIDFTYEYCTRMRLSDEEFRTKISDAFDKWLDKTKKSIL